MTLREYLRNPPVRMATDAEVRREFGVSLQEWLRAWREKPTEKQQTEALRKKGKKAA